MRSLRKTALLAVVGIAVLWFSFSMLFLHKLSDDSGPQLPPSLPDLKIRVIESSVDKAGGGSAAAGGSGAAVALTLAAAKLAALERENAELKRLMSSRSSASVVQSIPNSPFEKASDAAPLARDDSFFRASFDRFEAFVLKPSEDRIPGIGLPCCAECICVIVRGVIPRSLELHSILQPAQK